MSDVQRLLAEYIAEHRSGGAADPQAYLVRAPSQDRASLAALIDSYLVRVPRGPFDPHRYRGSSAERTVDELDRALRGQSGLWPALLPQLRHRAGLKRSELVDRLAGALGAADRATKVASYYHQMEQGLLPAGGVSDRVLDALGQLIGETAGSLREAGRSLGGPAAGAAPATAAFARRATADAVPAAPPHRPVLSEPTEWDEVDELFRGG